MNFRVVPQELYEHSYKVKEISVRSESAITAANELGGLKWHMSYGLLCNFFPIGMIPLCEISKSVLDKLAGAYDRSADGIYKSAQKYGEVDKAHAKHLVELAGVAGLTALDSHLVDPKSALKYSDYMVPGPSGDLGNFNPFTSGQGGNWTSGLSGLNDVRLLWEEVQKQKANVGSELGYTAGAANTFGKLLVKQSDPLDVLVSSGAAWAMEHLKPLKIILDGLAGNPDMISGAAKTWDNISTHLSGLSKQYQAEVTRGTGKWHGDAAEAYRTKTAHNLVDATESASLLAKCMGVIVAVTGEMVNFVRSTIRDWVASLVAKLVKSGLKRLVPIPGITTPTTGEIGEIVQTTSKAKKLLDALIEMFTGFKSLVSRAIDVFKLVSKIIPLLDGV